MNKPIDYTFMYQGGLADAVFNVGIQASRRFGADSALNVICTAMSMDLRSSRLGVLHEIKAETGLSLSEDDLDFICALISAKALISEAVKTLEEANG